MIICFILMVLCFMPYFILSGLIKYYARRNKTSKIKKYLILRRLQKSYLALVEYLRLF